MDERKKKVLQSIIQDYIATAEPVGSRTIARKYNLGVSPATIRNEMADLEELGYIEQPHTSAGRIPSDLGYRYYVDCLMEKQELNQAEKDYIDFCFSQKQKMEEIQSVIKQASELLSEMTHYTAMIVEPQWDRLVFEHIQLLPLGPGVALMVVVINSRIIQHYILNIPESISAADLEKVSLALNHKFKGFTLNQIKQDLLLDVLRENQQYKEIIDNVLGLFQQLNSLASKEKVHLGGTLNIFNQPEFKDIDKLRDLLSLLEEKEILKDILTRETKTGLTVKIGGENKHEGITGCSIITASYQIDGEILGSIGLLGPTRMAYSKAISLVEYVTQNLSLALAKLIK
ncbi:heat-inducible transcriptional repressor HrcA [Bacillota bacterium LX-D]|nr:heat-inducible transcriptional repressor HrcA [Bacillota bacterium LX-D]